MADSDNSNAFVDAGSIEATDVIDFFRESRLGKVKMTYTDFMTQVSAYTNVTASLDQKLAVVTDGVTDNENGTADVTMTFYRGGVQLATPLTGFFMVCTEAVGIAAVALGAGMTAVKGQITPNNAADYSLFYFVTNATGELDLTLDNGSADSFWLFFRGTAGEHLSSSEIAITGTP